MTKHVSKVDQGDKVTLPVKFADKPGLSLPRLLGWPQNKGNPLGLSLRGLYCDQMGIFNNYPSSPKAELREAMMARGIIVLVKSN